MYSSTFWSVIVSGDYGGHRGDPLSLDKMLRDCEINRLWFFLDKLSSMNMRHVQSVPAWALVFGATVSLP